MSRFTYVKPKPKKSSMPAALAVLGMGVFFGWLLAGAPMLAAVLRHP
jgi:hypothetical protein